MLNDAVTVIEGDCVQAMQDMPAASIHSIVTDPPYGLGFMGKEWDSLPPGQEWAGECLRVLKPGGHLLAFGGTRTWHRLAVAIEDAGFELRDSIAWLYSQGFPKSMEVSKAIVKMSPNEAPRWQGWGTALKPAFEPIVVARKPFVGTVAANVQACGTGALNIDGCRIAREEGDRTEYGRDSVLPNANNTVSLGKFKECTPYTPHEGGRWPANVILDEGLARSLDQARFFYCAKATKRERVSVNGVSHPTVKPLTLMRHLVRLVTPRGGVVLDPFAGSGATVEAAILEGFQVIGIEKECDYLPLIEARVARTKEEAC